MRWLALLLLTGCAPHYEWVEEPETPPSPAAERQEDIEEPSQRDRRCAGSTRAVRQQARMNRYRGVEGFDSRFCVEPGGGD